MKCTRDFCSVCWCSGRSTKEVSQNFHFIFNGCCSEPSDLIHCSCLPAIHLRERVCVCAGPYSFNFYVWGLRPGSKVRNGFRLRVDGQSRCGSQQCDLPVRVLTKVEVQECHLTDSNKFLHCTENVWSLCIWWINTSNNVTKNALEWMREVLQLRGKWSSLFVQSLVFNMQQQLTLALWRN